MKKEKMNNYIKAIVLSFFVFITGFIGSILVLKKDSSELASKIVNINGETKEYVEFFGVKLMGFVSKLEDGKYVVDIYESNYYDYVPFLAGFVSLLVVLILAFLCKKIIRK